MQTQKNIFYNVLLAISQLVFPIITFPYLARVLGPEQIGVINFAESIARYFVLLAALGIPIYGVREIAKRMNEKKALTILFFEIVIINFFTTLLLTGLFFLCIQFIPSLKVEKNLFYWAILYFILQMFYFEWFFIGMKQFKFIALRSFFIRFLFILFVFILIKSKNDYIFYMQLQVALSFIIALINYKYLIQLLDKSVLNIKKINLQKHIQPLFILFLTIFSISVYFSLDTILLGLMADNESVGYYSSSLKLTKLIIAVLGSVTAAVFPQLINLYHHGGELKFANMVKKCFQLVVGLSIPAIVLIIGLSNEIITIFLGNTFERAVLPLQITAPLILIVSLSGIFGLQVLSALAKDKSILLSTFLGMCISIVMSFILIPVWKEKGAAITILLTELTVCLSFIYFTNKYFRLNGYFEIFAKTVLQIIPYFIIIFLIKLIGLYYLYTVILVVTLSAVWFFTFHFILQENNIYKEQVLQIMDKIKNKT